MSAATLSFAAPRLDRTEFHVDRRRSAGVGITAVLIGGLIAWPALTLRPTLEGTGELLATGIALAGAGVLIALGASLSLRPLLRRGAVVVINAEGIHDRRKGAALPWSCIHDIRVLDRRGRLIGIETRSDPREESTGASALRRAQARVTVIDTFFLQSNSGDRILDFMLPITALAPLDMSELPVSEDTLSADARLSRWRTAAIVTFVVMAAFVPAAAAALLIIF